MIIDLGPLTIKLDVLIVQIINVLILFYLFNKLFGKELLAEIAERRAMTRRLEQAEKEYASLIAQAHAEKDAIINDALEHKKSLLDEASRLAKRERDEIVEKAIKDAERIVLQAQQDIESQKKDIERNFEQ
jgi:F0F1-type ATP synthase membrane subunit b/b'